MDDLSSSFNREEAEKITEKQEEFHHSIRVGGGLISHLHTIISPEHPKMTTAGSKFRLLLDFSRWITFGFW